MFCCRIFVFVLLLIFTAAATCSSLFPLFRYKGGGTKAQIFYWYTETNIPGTPHALIREYTRDLACTESKNFFIASSALSTSGAAFGGIATLFAFAHILHSSKCCLCTFIMIFSILACLCYVVCIALMANLYLSGKCNTQSFKRTGYDLVEGFGLMVSAAGGFLISTIFEIFS